MADGDDAWSTTALPAPLTTDLMDQFSGEGFQLLGRVVLSEDAPGAAPSTKSKGKGKGVAAAMVASAAANKRRSKAQ